MSNMFTPAPNEFRVMPKVDLHRHLEGSLRLQTMVDVARQHGITIPVTVVRLSRLVQVQDEDNLTFENFLAKFNTLRMFYRSPDVIDRITREAIEDAAKDNVRYLELRFTPVALSRAERFPMHDVMDWVCESAKNGAKIYGVTVLLIASVSGKLIGVHAAGKVLKWKPGEASIIGWLLQTKALIMIIFVNILLDKQIITSETFTALLLMAVASTMLTVPLVSPKLEKMKEIIFRSK